MVNEKTNIKSYHVLPGPKMGLITPEYLEQVAEVIRKYNIPFAKLTGAQRIAIAGHPLEHAEKIWSDMGQECGPKKPVGIHYIQACPGIKWCQYGKLDSIALGKKLKKPYLMCLCQQKPRSEFPAVQ